MKKLIAGIALAGIVGLGGSVSAATGPGNATTPILQAVGGVLSWLAADLGNPSVVVMNMADTLTSLHNVLAQLTKLLQGISFAGHTSSTTSSTNQGMAVAAAHGGLDNEAQDHILVKFKSNVGQTTAAAVLAKHGLSVGPEIKDIGVKVVAVPDSMTPDEAVQDLKAAESSSIEFAEPDYVASVALTPNDPDYTDQWHLPQISAPAGWDITTGVATTLIAMIDSGVDPTHPDFAGKLLPGYNFVLGTTNTADLNGHGTETAGTAAADTNNATGVAGVDWGSDIMPLVVCNSSNYCLYSNIASALTYAADHGAKVANISIGGTGYSSAMQSAINYAWSKGLVVIAAAGNSATSTPLYPAADQNVVAVSATCDAANNLAGWSNYGADIDLAAPGCNIFTAHNGGGYGYVNGTSFSAPIVAGVAALLFSKNPSLTNSQVVSLMESNADSLPAGSTGWNQDFGYGLIDAAHALSAAGNGPAPDTAPPSAPASLTAAVISPSEIDLAWAASADNIGVAGYRIYRNGSQVATVTGTSYNDTGLLPSTSYSYTVYAYDAAGNVSGVSNTASVTTLAAVTTTTSTPPAAAVSVTSFRVTAKTRSTATITWTTNIPSTGVVSYGATKSLSLTAIDSTTGTSHSVTLSGLSTFMTYYYKITATSQDGATSAQTNLSSFKTSKR